MEEEVFVTHSDIAIALKALPHSERLSEWRRRVTTVQAFTSVFGITDLCGGRELWYGTLSWITALCGVSIIPSKTQRLSFMALSRQERLWFWLDLPI